MGVFDWIFRDRRVGDPSFDPENALRSLAVGALQDPMELLIAFQKAHKLDGHPRRFAIANFDLHSSFPRLFILDPKTRTMEAYLCAHGRGSADDSDQGRATVFSNTPRSMATSLGIYRCSETYRGRNGYSLRLDGLQSTNSNARSRKIVIHGSTYVSAEFVTRHGHLGCSDGCLAIDHQYARSLIDQLKNGSLVLSWRSSR